MFASSRHSLADIDDGDREHDYIDKTIRTCSENSRTWGTTGSLGGAPQADGVFWS